jgi:hypothetical protein
LVPLLVPVFALQNRCVVVISQSTLGGCYDLLARSFFGRPTSSSLCRRDQRVGRVDVFGRRGCEDAGNSLVPSTAPVWTGRSVFLAQDVLEDPGLRLAGEAGAPQPERHKPEVDVNLDVTST